MSQETSPVRPGSLFVLRRREDGKAEFRRVAQVWPATDGAVGFDLAGDEGEDTTTREGDFLGTWVSDPWHGGRDVLEPVELVAGDLGAGA